MVAAARLEQQPLEVAPRVTAVRLAPSQVVSCPDPPLPQAAPREKLLEDTAA
jgi:hypothetical protein